MLCECACVQEKLGPHTQTDRQACTRRRGGLRPQRGDGIAKQSCLKPITKRAAHQCVFDLVKSPPSRRLTVSISSARDDRQPRSQRTPRSGDITPQWLRVVIADANLISRPALDAARRRLQRRPLRWWQPMTIAVV